MMMMILMMMKKKIMAFEYKGGIVWRRSVGERKRREYWKVKRLKVCMKIL
jgi:hypothetical protein